MSAFACPPKLLGGGMPFVFVHGVNVRKGPDYDRDEQIRAAFLRKIVAPVIGINTEQTISSPYWGDKGIRFWNNLKVIPQGQTTEALGPGADEPAPPSLEFFANQPPVESPVGLDTIARDSPEAAIDLLFDYAIGNAQSAPEIETLAEAYRLAQIRLQAGDSGWLSASDDAVVLDRVFSAVNPPTDTQAFGAPELWRLLQQGSERLTNFLPDQLSHALLGVLREPLSRNVATFFGDAFQYLAERGDGQKAGPIASTVMESLTAAASVAHASKEPLVVISHSFGGEIVYDILTHYANNTDLEIDMWVTVGSQVGLFEEMSLLWSSPGRLDPAAAPKEAIVSPKRAKRWINIVDTNDVLGFLVLPTFTGATPGAIRDFTYNTGLGTNAVHSGYFKWPSFYKRLAQRISESK